MAVARAVRVLDRPDWLAPCVDTVHALVEPILDKLFPVIPYAWPADPSGRPLALPGTPCRWIGTAYHVSSLVAGLAELALATGDRSYGEAAVRVSNWLLGHNPAQVSMYQPTLGGCYDGIHGQRVNRNLGTESSIEAGRAE